MQKIINIHYFHQKKEYTCGPASMEMLFSFFGIHLKESTLARQLKTTKSGTTHSSLIKEAKKFGFYCFAKRNSTLSQLKSFINSNLPPIINYIEINDKEGHYAVAIGYDKNNIILNDPWDGRKFKIPYKIFSLLWKKHSHNWLLVVSKDKISSYYRNV